MSGSNSQRKALTETDILAIGQTIACERVEGISQDELFELCQLAIKGLSGPADGAALPFDPIAEYHRLMVAEWEKAYGRPCAVAFPNDVEKAAIVALCAKARASSEAGAERAARQALANIKWDVHNCDWSCDACTADQGMADTDIALTIQRFEERHGALPPPYATPDDGGKK